MPSETTQTTDHRRPTTVKSHHAPPQEPEHLPCPRCDSTNTKFCYYNNYNFSQPRHYCKACRRYWTHGGTLRDIPIGGASRKGTKRPRVSVSTATSNDSGVSSGGFEHRNITTPVFMPLGGGHGGSFTSLLSGVHGPVFVPEMCGFDQDVSFGLGRTIWPFSGGVGGGQSGGAGGGSAWQVEGGDGFVWPDLKVSKPGSAMK